MYEPYEHPFSKFILGTEGCKRNHINFYNRRSNSNGSLIENKMREQEDRSKGLNRYVAMDCSLKDKIENVIENLKVDKFWKP